MTQMYLTSDDYQNYGSDLVSFAQRAAIQATAPHLDALQQQNAALEYELARERRHRLDAQVAEAVPNYQQIDNDPAWHRWLLGLDPLNGCVRQEILNDAIAQADAGRVRAFFESFQREAQGADRGPARRGGRSPSSHGAPTYTREQIRALYEQHRKGTLTGAAWEAQERDIFAAQHEGRVLGHPYLTK
jgi:hypothetical protein